MSTKVNTLECKNTESPTDRVTSFPVDDNLEDGGNAGSAVLREKKTADYWVGLVHIFGDKAWTMKRFGDEFRPVSMPAKDYLESLTGKKPAPVVPQKAPETPPVKQKPVAKIAHKENIKGPKREKGRPKAISSVDAVAKIMDMSKTMSSRSIAKELTDGGTPIDHSTVTRIIKGQRQLL